MNSSKFSPLIILFFLLILSKNVLAQHSADTLKRNSPKLWIIIKNEGKEYIGNIVSQNPREVLIKTEKLGEVAIPMHEVSRIREVNAGEITSSGKYIPADAFSRRYFITTNALPIERGDGIITLNLFGPDMQMGLRQNLEVGLMSSWGFIPIIASVRYTLPVADHIHLGVGTFLGIGAWVAPEFGVVMPYTALTIGNHRTNLTFSGGYGAVFTSERNIGRTLLSISAMKKISTKSSIIFDSFIAPSKEVNIIDNFSLLIPGIRIQTSKLNAFQFSLTGMSIGGEFIPFMIPMFQWFRKM